MHVKSIKTALIFPTVLLILITGLFVSYLSLQTARNAVIDVSGVLHQNISLRVIDHLDEFFSIPQKVLTENAWLLKQRMIDANDPETLQNRFLQESRLYRELNSIYFGNPAGSLTVAGREADDKSL